MAKDYKCKICGKPHYGPCDWRKTKALPAAKAIAKHIEQTRPVPETIRMAEPVSVLPDLADLQAQLNRIKEQNRERARAYRARKKEQK